MEALLTMMSTPCAAEEVLIDRSSAARLIENI